MSIFTGRENMKVVRYTGLVMLLALMFGVTASAQRKPAKKPANKATASKSTIPPLDVRVAREKVSNQLDNVSRFVDLLGPIAQSIESLDESAKATPLSSAANDRNEANKQKVIAAIRNLRAGLSDLESDFRTKPNLQRYRAGLDGITDLAAQSEDSAIAGHFVASKEPLRTAAQKLTDTLKILPMGSTAGPY
jgi:uncharacterized phage infection (PIP) family protein YhgE